LIQKSANPKRCLEALWGRKTDKAAVFDHDDAAADFERAIKACTKYKGEAAYSNRNFDLWLLLHKQPFLKSVTNNNDYVNHVRKAYGLDNDADIKKEKEMERILKQITLQDVKTAIHNVKAIRNSKIKSDAKKIGKVEVYDNPDLMIHQFIEDVFKECDEPIT